MPFWADIDSILDPPGNLWGPAFSDMKAKTDALPSYSMPARKIMTVDDFDQAYTLAMGMKGHVLFIDMDLFMASSLRGTLPDFFQIVKPYFDGQGVTPLQFSDGLNTISSDVNCCDTHFKHKPNSAFDPIYAHGMMDILKDICQQFLNEKDGTIVLATQPRPGGLPIYEWLTAIGPGHASILVHDKRIREEVQIGFIQRVAVAKNLLVSPNSDPNVPPWLSGFFIDLCSAKHYAPIGELLTDSEKGLIYYLVNPSEKDVLATLVRR